MRANLQRGFTLTELIVGLGIAGIMMAIALPSFRNATLNTAITTESNSLIAALNFARNEAARYGTRVVLCRSADPNANVPSCGGTENTWTSGWLIYSVGDARTTPLYNTSNGDVLLATGKPNGIVTIKTSSAANKNFEYSPDGSTNEGGQTGTFAICDDRGVDHGKQITVLPVGRPKVEDAVTCTPS